MSGWHQLLMINGLLIVNVFDYWLRKMYEITNPNSFTLFLKLSL